ncbi:MAG: trigger factor [Solirubrobacterales bacterium]
MTPITVSTTELPEAKAKLEIEVSPDLVEHSIKHAAEHMAEQVKLPGFRKGKVPPELALQRLGNEAVFEHAFDESVGGWYADALAETDIAPIGSPSLSAAPEYRAGEPLKFELEVPVRPDAELGDYRGIEVGRREPDPDVAAVESELQVMRDRFSTLAPVERAARGGDFVDIDFTGSIDGEEFEGGAGSDYVLEIGSGQFIPGFEEQIVGGSAGDELDVNVKFPDDYGAEHLAGADALFKVKINAVQEKLLAELTDEFAAENLGYDTIEELRNEILSRIQDETQQEVDREYRWAVVDAVAKQAKVEIPHGHIHSRAHELWRELATSLARRGIDPRMFLQAQGKSEHEFIDSAEGDAELTIRREAVIARLVDDLGIEVSDDEMVDAIAEDMGEEREKAQEQFDLIKEAGGIDQLAAELKSRKAIDHLVEVAKPIPIEQAEAREAIWTPDKEAAEGAAKPAGGEGLWTPGS